MPRSWTLVLTLLFSALSLVDSVSSADLPSNETLLWGPYKPNLYFGVRPRIPQSFFAGLIWASVEDFQATQACELFSLS